MTEQVAVTHKDFMINKTLCGDYRIGDDSRTNWKDVDCPACHLRRSKKSLGDKNRIDRRKKQEGVPYTICVDFDGVIHQYKTPFSRSDEVPDPPVPRALEWLEEMTKYFEVVIFSTRCETKRGRLAMKEWFKDWDFDPGRLKFSYEKIPALIYLDDRAVRFTGANFPTKNEIHQDLRPWNKTKEEPNW